MQRTRPSAQLLLAALVAAAVLGGAAPVRADASVTLVNADGSGHQITRYDTQGNAINAHGSGIHKFGATYYLYGEDQSCGWFYSSASPTPRPPCGLKAYSSPDLIHWTPEGPLFDVTAAFWRDACKSSGGTGGCWEPHVLYRQATDDYVLWILTDGRYYVLRADRPVGPFTEIGYATVARPPAQGDFDLLLDADGSAYIAFSNNNDRHIYVERLNGTFTSGSGVHVDTGAIGEGTALFARAGLYYVVYGPLCAYCPAATRYRSASALMGRWSAERQISSDSCSGQPRKVSPIDTPSGPLYLFQSDQWNGSYNEALANYFWGPLAFRADGSIQTLSCARTVGLTLSGTRPGALRPPPELDQTSGQIGFTTSGACEIRDGGSRNRLAICDIASRLGVPVQAGGGVRDESDLYALFRGHVASAVVGSVAVRDPERVIEWARVFGRDRIVVALDTRLVDGAWTLPLHGWTEASGIDLHSRIALYLDAGLDQFLITDIARDGMMGGPSLDLYRALRSRYPDARIQASGGVDSIASLSALKAVGVAGAIVGRALLEGRFSLAEANAC